MSFDFEAIDEAVRNGHLSAFEGDCIKERGRKLTGRFAHYCFDWDGMTVDETCPGEITSCHCTIDGVEVPPEVKAAAEEEMAMMEEECRRLNITDLLPTPPDPSDT